MSFGIIIVNNLSTTRGPEPMQLLTPLLIAAILCRALPVVAQSSAEPPVAPTMGIDNILSIRLEEPAVPVPGKVSLKWELASLRRGGYVNLERSAFREGPFEIVAVVRQDSSIARFTDEQPLRGRSFYRLKWMLGDGTQYISNTTQVDLAGNMTCKFYPNPVDNVLIVRSEQTLDLMLADAGGKVRINLKLKPGLQTVDVSSLPKGIYIITLTSIETGNKLTEKLLKN